MNTHMKKEVVHGIDKLGVMYNFSNEFLNKMEKQSHQTFEKTSKVKDQNKQKQQQQHK